MSGYYPDSYKFIRVTTDYDESSIYKIFAVWNGGYTSSDCWRVNSGITKIEEVDNQYYVHGYSNSVYVIPKMSAAMSSYGERMFKDIQTRAGIDGICVEEVDVKQVIENVGDGDET